MARPTAKGGKGGKGGGGGGRGLKRKQAPVKEEESESDSSDEDYNDDDDSASGSDNESDDSQDDDDDDDDDEAPDGAQGPAVISGLLGEGGVGTLLGGLMGQMQNPLVAVVVLRADGTREEMKLDLSPKVRFRAHQGHHTQRGVTFSCSLFSLSQRGAPPKHVSYCLRRVFLCTSTATHTHTRTHTTYTGERAGDIARR
jgi:hypothetical protein